MLYARTSRLMLAGAALVCLSSQAFALDGADLMKKFNAAAAVGGGGSVTYDSVATEGSTVTLKGVALEVPGKPEKLKVGDVTLTGVEETTGGGYAIETVDLPDINVKEQDASVSVADIAINGLTIPGNPAGTTLNDIMLSEKASTGPVSVIVKGKPVFSMGSSEINLARQESDTGFDFDSKLAGIKADLSGVEDAKAKEAIEKLGLVTLNGDVTMKGSWETASGNVAIDEYAFDIANVGRLNLELGISGYTMQFVKAMQEAFKAAEANPNKEEANQALGFAAMGLMQQLTFNNAEIRFDDATITKRVLDYVGAQQGVTGDQMAQSLKGLLPIMLAQLNIPELQNQIVTAANAYLDQPKSLTISATPSKPVPFPMIVGAAMGAPNSIPSVLGVTVTAND